MRVFSMLIGRRRSRHDVVNIASPVFKANPYPFYARLRADEPVYRVTLPTRETAWLITRYDDVVAVLKDERFVKNRANALTPEQAARQVWFRKLLIKMFSKLFKSRASNLLDQDPPNHSRLRALVNKAFTPRLVEQRRERIQRVTDDLVDLVQSQGRMDLIRDYALPLPTTVIAEILGVPTADRHRFHRWLKAMARARSTWEIVKAVPSVLLFLRYLRKLIQRRRTNPQADLVTALAQAEEAGDALSEEELWAIVALLLFAGYETTANLIGNGTLALLEHPDQMDRLRNEPALIQPAVEELLRFASPVAMATERYAREDVTVADVTIPRGDLVYAVIASANRDERQFPNPDTLDIAREPNKHLAFGLGTHFCLGAPLARLEGQIAISTLLRRAPDLRLTAALSALRWHPVLLSRGLEALPVAFGKHGGKGEQGLPAGKKKSPCR